MVHSERSDSSRSDHGSSDSDQDAELGPNIGIQINVEGTILWIRAPLTITVEQLKLLCVDAAEAECRQRGGRGLEGEDRDFELTRTFAALEESQTLEEATLEDGETLSLR